jgi:hypothetical protein
LSKGNRVFKIEKRRKELKRQKKKEKKMAKRLDKSGSNENQNGPVFEEQKEKAQTKPV